MSKKQNQKADVHNPNNQSRQKALDNRSRQLNPQYNEEHRLNTKPLSELDKK
jgi:hypothetical protein